MPDEATPTIEAPMTTEGSEPVEAPVIETPAAPASAEVTPPVAETPDWQAELDKVDSKLLRKHPRIAGMIGSEIQRAQAAHEQRVKTDADRRAAVEAEANLRRLAEEDPMTFAEQWLSQEKQVEIRRQLDTTRGSVRQELATSIGRAYNDLPEWAELTDVDHARLAEAVAGKPDDEVISHFNRAAFDLVVEKRVQKKLADFRAKDLAKERESIRQEEAAKLLRNSEAPDITPPKRQPANFNPASLPDKEFSEWWEAGKR